MASEGTAASRPRTKSSAVLYAAGIPSQRKVRTFLFHIPSFWQNHQNKLIMVNSVYRSFGMSKFWWPNQERNQPSLIDYIFQCCICTAFSIHSLDNFSKQEMFQPWPFFCLQKNCSTTVLSQHISQNAQNQIFYMPPVRISKAEFFVVKSSSSTDT